jgi:hypothetical protein
MNIPRGEEENEGFLETTRFLNEATLEITGKLGHWVTKAWEF